MSKPNVSMLRLALRNIKVDDKSSEKAPDELEQAMSDFQSATTSTERAAAFRAAIELAKSE